MFKKTRNEQLDMFRHSYSLLSITAQKKLEEEHSWNQVVFNNFVSKIDESIYSVLYTSNRGRPNASIRVLLGMMLIKELNGWSDEQLFDQCMFNFRVKSALGILHADQDVPVESTYYDFRKKVAQYLQETGIDLIEQTFNTVCAEQMQDLDISGSKVRMDSKLIQSNIAWLNRLQFILEVLRKHIEPLDVLPLKAHLQESQFKLLLSFREKTTSNITYNLSKADKEKMLISLGQMIQVMIKLNYVQTDTVLYKVFEEQYESSQDNDDQPPSILLKSSKEIGSDSIQSVHDTDAGYRTKGKEGKTQKVQGYHSNITETCDEEGKPNLITNVITNAANVSECEFLEPAIQSTEEKLTAGNKIDKVITDGGYDSKANRTAMEKSQVSWDLQKLKGPKHVYNMNYNEAGQLEVRDKKTDEVLEVKWSTRAEKYVIKNTNGSSRYLEKQKVTEYIQASKILAEVNKDDSNLRANVEASIHEVFHRLGRRNKIKYRGIIKCHWYVLFRAMSVNVGRIARHLEQILFFILSCIYMLVINRKST